jgi:hypothetical protein
MYYYLCISEKKQRLHFICVSVKKKQRLYCICVSVEKKQRLCLYCIYVLTQLSDVCVVRSGSAYLTYVVLRK